MKILSASLFFLGGLLPLSAQVTVTPKWDVEIPLRIIDSTPSVPAPKPEPIEFKVLSSKTTRMEVEEAPEMSDLPPITGTINVTVQVVEDPNLPNPPPPATALPAADAARVAELRKQHRSTKFVCVSATVYDHSRTYIRINPFGRVGESVTAWSNLDFNYLSGFPIFRVKDALDGTVHDFSLLMNIGNTDTRHFAELAQKKHVKFKAPEIPKIPDLVAGGPSFILVEGDAKSAAMDTLEQLHDLYRKEGARMEEAYLLANPRKPEDIVIKFWESSPLKSK